jgi:hypothetical protein
MPLLLFPDKKSTMTLTGFYSKSGVPSDPIQLEYQVSNQALSASDRKQFNTAETSPRLLKALEMIRRKRSKITSLSEHVQVLSLASLKNGSFTELTAEDASFKWQWPEQFYVDAADMVLTSSAFEIGSDGKNCWWRDDSDLEVCPATDIQKTKFSLCDPFGLAHRTPQQAASAQNLKYIGVVEFDHTNCQFLEGWGWDPVAPSDMTPIGFLTQWWVDKRTGLPLSIRVFWVNYIQKTRILYDSVNESLPPKDFTVPQISSLSPRQAEPLGEGYTNRFIDVNDGSDGNMLIHYGVRGPKGSQNNGYGNFE